MWVKLTDLKYYMHFAIEQARKAAKCSEVPIGAILVNPDGIIKQSSHNLVLRKSDPTAHAELNVVRAECESINNERLLNYRLFVTLEPCAMCAAALSYARVSQIVYGASDKKSGGVECGPKIFTHSQIHHKPEIIGGVNKEICSEIIQNFFKLRR